MNGDRESISTERALRMLSDRQRHAVVDRLAAESTETTVDRLATTPDDAASTASSESPGAELLVRLHHVHLPALAQANVVQYDPASGVVRRGEAFETARSLLDTFDAHWDDESREDF